MRKAKFWAPIIGRLPGVAAVFLSGSLAQGRSGPDSDIDFFIIAYPGKIWTARFYTNVLLKITFNLSKPQHHAHRICPNHFITSQTLEIVEKDAYSAHLFSHNQPLFDPHNLWKDFVLANDWVRLFGESFPVLLEIPNTPKPLALPFSTKPGGLEKVLRWGQRQKIYRNPEFKTPGAKIVLRDTELRFHPQPKNQYWKNQKSVDLAKANRQAPVDIQT